MAKIKNVGDQPRGFFTDQGGHVVIEPGDEAEFNMTEADFNRLKELNEAESAENPPLEIGGSFGGVKAKAGQGGRDPATDPLSQMQREKEATQKQAAEEEKKAEERAKQAEKAEKAEGKAEREPEREAHKRR